MTDSLVYVSITVDDLGARGDPDRSDRVSTYRATPDEVRALLEMVRRLKGRPAGEVWNSTDAPPKGDRIGVVENVRLTADGLFGDLLVDDGQVVS